MLWPYACCLLIVSYCATCLVFLQYERSWFRSQAVESWSDVIQMQAVSSCLHPSCLWIRWPYVFLSGKNNIVLKWVLAIITNYKALSCQTYRGQDILSRKIQILNSADSERGSVLRNQKCLFRHFKEVTHHVHVLQKTSCTQLEGTSESCLWGMSASASMAIQICRCQAQDKEGPLYWGSGFFKNLCLYNPT